MFKTVWAALKAVGAHSAALWGKIPVETKHKLFVFVSGLFADHFGRKYDEHMKARTGDKNDR